MDKKIYILIVEDEYIAAKYLQKIIEESFEDMVVCEILRSVEDAKEYLKKYRIDIVLIDILLDKDIEGTKLAEYIKEKNIDTLAIFLTAYSNKEYIKDAAKSRAFAYLLKPYRSDEITATLELAKEQILEKRKNKESRFLFLADGFYYDLINKRLCKNNKEVELAPLELKLIQLLCANSNIITERDTLCNSLNISCDSLRSLIYRLRHSLSENLIISHRRLGYKIAKAK